jgi:hypothetical protein
MTPRFHEPIDMEVYLGSEVFEHAVCVIQFVIAQRLFAEATIDGFSRING